MSTHAYEKDAQSGAGNCVCGAPERHMRHPHAFMLPAFVNTTNCCCTQPFWADCHGSAGTGGTETAGDTK